MKVESWKPVFSRLKAALSGMLLALLTLHPQPAMQAARDSCRLWATSVLPALFPYLTLSRLLLQTAGGAFSLPVAMLAGSPAGAQLIALTERGKSAHRKAALCATASPLFLLGTLGGGWKMLAAHWLGALAACAFACLFPASPRKEARAISASEAPLGEIIADSALSMLSVCGCMVFFSVVAALAETLWPMRPAARALLAAVLEMAGGCARIRSLGLPDGATNALLCAAASFGGLSVFWQNARYLREAGVDLRVQFASKLLHAATAYGLYRILP